MLTAPDVAEDVELADSVSTAMLLVLETLPPVERAVFVLREVFDFPYSEIAASVDKSEAAVRQIAHRARSHVEARRPREQLPADAHGAVLARFLDAVNGGDIQALMDAMAPDIVLITDGGGFKQAALRPILGAEKVLRFLAGVYQASTRAEIVSVNGSPGLRLELDGELEAVATFTFEGDLVTGAYIVRNPHKLVNLDGNERLLTR